MYMVFLSFLISPKKLILSSCQIYFVIKCNNLHNFPEFNTINDLYLHVKNNRKVWGGD